MRGHFTQTSSTSTFIFRCLFSTEHEGALRGAQKTMSPPQGPRHDGSDVSPTSVKHSMSMNHLGDAVHNQPLGSYVAVRHGHSFSFFFPPATRTVRNNVVYFLLFQSLHAVFLSCFLPSHVENNDA